MASWPSPRPETCAVALIDQGARLFDPVLRFGQVTSASSSKAAATRGWLMSGFDAEFVVTGA